MGTVGDCYDNAPVESFWGSMQVELLNRQRWRANLELAVAMANYPNPRPRCPNTPPHGVKA
jgi:putative transposase